MQLYDYYPRGRVTIVIETGRVRFTRQGYRCMSCGFNFRFDLTSPVTECPECGSIINDKIAYYVSRASRGLGIAFAFTLIIVFSIIFITQDNSLQMQNTVAMVGVAAFLPLAAIFIYLQMWSLILTRIMYRGILFIVVMMLLTLAVSGILGGLKIYEMSGPMVAAIGFALGLILTLASYLVIKLNRDTYDHVED